MYGTLVSPAILDVIWISLNVYCEPLYIISSGFALNEPQSVTIIFDGIEVIVIVLVSWNIL